MAIELYWGSGSLFVLRVSSANEVRWVVSKSEPANSKGCGNTVPLGTIKSSQLIDIPGINPYGECTCFSKWPSEIGRNTSKASNLSFSLRTIPNGQTDQSVASAID